MPAQIQVSQRNKKDALDYVTQGLQVAGGILGAYKGVQDIRSNSLTLDKQRREAMGPTEFDLAAKGFRRKSPIASVPGSTGSPIAAGPDSLNQPTYRFSTADSSGNRTEGEYVRDEDVKQSQDLLKHYQDKFVQDTRKGKELLLAAYNANGLLSGGPISQEAVKTQIARLTGEVGGLTENDVARFGGSKALSEKIDQYFTSLADGTLTPANRSELQNIINTFENSAREQITQTGAGHAAQLSQTTGMSQEEAFKRLAVEAFSGLLKSPSKKKSRIEEMEEELRKRKRAK